jgi:hypothetical protein
MKDGSNGMTQEDDKVSQIADNLEGLGPTFVQENSCEVVFRDFFALRFCVTAM